MRMPAITTKRECIFFIQPLGMRMMLMHNKASRRAPSHIKTVHDVVCNPHIVALPHELHGPGVYRGHAQ